MCHSSLESSHNGESNGGKIILSRSLDAEILSETSKISILYFTILRHLTFHLISRHPMIIESVTYLLESSHNDEPNGGKIILLRSLDAKILSETSNDAIS